MTIKDILKAEEYDFLNRFTDDEKNWLNDRIMVRRDGKPGVECYVRGLNSDGDYFELTPEEIVRQLYAHKLIDDYGYSRERLKFEALTVFAGREAVKQKRTDITVYSDDTKEQINMIIEIKRPSVRDENTVYAGEAASPRKQMASYCLLNKAQIGVLANGGNLQKFYVNPDFENALVIDQFPKCGEDLKEWMENRRFTFKQLLQNDRLQKETLKDIILRVEQRFGANDSSDKAFEEIFKLIFTKLYDEVMSSMDADTLADDMNRHHVMLQDVDDADFRALEFRARDSESVDEIYSKINKLFGRAQKKWRGVFPEKSVLNMQKATVKSCVKELQDVKLFNSNLEVVDDAFEHLVNQNQKEGMGQYFTPRYVIDMCVKMLNPKADERMIDTAAGSCGFPMHTIFHVWQQINPDALHLFTTRKRKPAETEYVQNNVFGIDFSEKSVRVGRMLNIIAGDGHTNVLELNSIDYRNWQKDYIQNKEWWAKYGDGFLRLQELCTDQDSAESVDKYKCFNFDVLMANPPFAGDLDNKEQIEQYELSYNAQHKLRNKVGRDILFIERNLNFLKPGGRMAVVLPQGRFNNANDKYIRDYIVERCRILAVVGLHGNVFKPHTGTKTSVLFVQKWTDEDCGFPNICPRPQADENGNIDYPIFFAAMQEPSKDNSGDKIYVTETYVAWSSYTYETAKCYIRKTDNQAVTEKEYLVSGRRSDYKVKIEMRKIPEEHTTVTGEHVFIKDLFVEQYGSLDSHRKWILKSCKFVLRKSIEGEKRAKELSICEYLKLEKEEALLYKEMPIIGKNTNPLISLEEYQKLSKAEQKYYLVAEDVKEFTERVKDTHGHIFVKHDLFNHDPDIENVNPHNIYSQDGIAEAFAEFAKKEGLSFFR